MVRDPVGYPWSSYRSYLGREKVPSWVRLHPTLHLVAKEGQQRRYQAFAEWGLDEEIDVFYRKGRLEPVLGGEEFRHNTDEMSGPGLV
ncbi:hypothetical protein DESUT3_40740 [Desulfuromonas versatilis]|uniref:Uncharacterized protein n=2 Tax=Desulfuromonas versatilis TaxID=2802975 RepID=A0ABN6E3U2_9BACT|nr:hypothetical protein DESUT3_40740 [Desulfuromonas versatilis]